MPAIKVEKEYQALGTDVYIQILSAPDLAEKARTDIDNVEKIFNEKETILSRFKPESELSFLNSHLGEMHKASKDIIYLAGRSLYYYTASDGLFDPRIIDTLENIGYKESFKNIGAIVIKTGKIVKISSPLANDLKIEGDIIVFNKRMDFAGIAKGYICDLAADYLKSQGWKNFLVDAGGDMFAAGKNHEGRDWIIDIENQKRETIYVDLSDLAIATSGVTRRQWAAEGKKFHHLVNPKHPKIFDFGIQSVTVTGQTVESCDMWAKTLFLMGEKAKTYISEHDIKAVLIYEDGQSWRSF